MVNTHSTAEPMIAACDREPTIPRGSRSQAAIFEWLAGGG
jgi:hypothetical protein